MRFVALSLLSVVLSLSGCHSTPRCANCENAQSVVDAVAKQNPECTRLTVHCAMEGGAKCCASTKADKIGKPSDKEDLEAMQTGKNVVLDEAGAIDVTVPFRKEGDTFRSACGVTLKADGMTREQAVAKATAIAKAVEDGLKGCSDCCCK